MSRLCSYTAFFCCFLSVLAQPQGRIISKDDALADLVWFERVVSNVHIGAINRNISEQIQQSFARAKFALDTFSQLNIYQFYKLLLNAYFTIDDVHSALYLSNKDQRYLVKHAKYLGFDIKITNDKCYAIHSRHQLIPDGSRILAINNIPDTILLLTLKQMVPSEANNTFTKKAFIERFFKELIPIAIDIQDQNTITFIRPDSNDTLTALVPSKHIPERYFSSTKPSPSYHEITLYPSLSTAYVVIQSFKSGSDSEFDDFLMFVFATLKTKNIQNLILDLRNNFGGYTSRGAKLLSYLIADTVPFIHHIVVKKSLELEMLIKQRSMNLSFLQNISPFGELMKHMKQKSYGTIDTIYMDPVQPVRENLFRGNIFVLINGLTISTSGLVCLALRDYRGAVFIGEPIPITLSGTFGQPIQFTLPKTKIRGTISTMRFNANNKHNKTNSFFEPDIYITPTIDDILNQRDVVLEKTLEIIRKRKQ